MSLKTVWCGGRARETRGPEETERDYTGAARREARLVKTVEARFVRGTK